jgi:hypothetical protein
VELLTVNVASVPPKRTVVTPVKRVPVITTDVPGSPCPGLKLVIVGAGSVTVKSVALVALPAEFVTVIRPVVAPAGTVAVILVGELTVKVALTPPMRTVETPVKFVPVMTTSEPTGPVAGANEVIVGWTVTTKSEALVPVPIEVTTEILPVAAPAGTTVVICVGELTVNAAFTVPNRTTVVPLKPVPVSTTVVPTGPFVGEKELITGAPCVTVKLVVVVAVPEGEVTDIAPEVAPAGTTAVIRVGELMVNVALAPLNLTVVTSSRFVPLICTLVPGAPLVGENEEIVGGLAVTTKLLELTAVPDAVTTLIAPVAAPDGTVAVIWVEELTV